MIKAVIVEDEDKSAEVLKQLLQRHCPQVEVAGIAGNVESGISLIRETGPDLVFLDIEMPGGTGFDLLQQVSERNFDVIFTTAYLQYAIKAIKFSAMDYILKPIDAEELKEAVERVAASSGRAEINGRLEALLANLDAGSRFKKIVIPDSEGLAFVEIDKIIRCESEGNYTLIYIEGEKRIMATRTLGDYEEMLSDDNFVRIHRSHLINLVHVKKYIKGEGGYVVMSDGSEVEVSRRKKAEFLERVGNS